MEDMAQPGYKNQWGKAGRDDFGIMKRMGANTIRLYHPIGEENFFGRPQPDHGSMLDAAADNGLKVFGAVHQYLTCADDDCFENWNYAVREGLGKGFARMDGHSGKWHPAVSTINIINEVDAIVPFNNASRQVKRLISALDGLFKAEQGASVQGSVNLTSCFTTAIASPLGGGKATIYHGFTSMENWLKNTSLVDYKPRSFATAQELAKEIDRRWVHCINAQIPWKNGLDQMIATKYGAEDAGFLPRPWILGEMGWNGAHQDAIIEELGLMHEWALGGHGFAGTFVFQFQTAYQKTGAELNYGMFGLAENKTIGSNVHPNGKTFPIHCLTSRLFAFEQPWSQCKSQCNHRAQAVAKAFEGSLSGTGLCLEEVPLPPWLDSWRPRKGEERALPSPPPGGAKVVVV